jgi:hypothetical protein
MDEEEDADETTEKWLLVIIWLFGFVLAYAVYSLVPSQYRPMRMALLFLVLWIFGFGVAGMVRGRTLSLGDGWSLKLEDEKEAIISSMMQILVAVCAGVFLYVYYYD